MCTNFSNLLVTQVEGFIGGRHGQRFDRGVASVWFNIVTESEQ